MFTCTWRSATKICFSSPSPISRNRPRHCSAKTPHCVFSYINNNLRGHTFWIQVHDDIYIMLTLVVMQILRFGVSFPAPTPSYKDFTLRWQHIHKMCSRIFFSRPLGQTDSWEMTHCELWQYISDEANMVKVIVNITHSDHTGLLCSLRSARISINYPWNRRLIVRVTSATYIKVSSSRSDWCGIDPWISCISDTDSGPKHWRMFQFRLFDGEIFIQNSEVLSSMQISVWGCHISPICHWRGHWKTCFLMLLLAVGASAAGPLASSTEKKH